MSTKLLATHTMMGRTLILHLHATTVMNTATSLSNLDTFDINGMVIVRVRIDHDYNENKHVIYLSTKLHELAKDNSTKVNILCDKLKFADKWTCSEKWSEWIQIGKLDCFTITVSHSHHKTFISASKITISVYKMPTYKSSQLYNDTDFTDFTLSTLDGKVDVHKACLAAHSPVFKTMFTGTWKETKDNLMEIKGYSLQTVQHLKEFLYLGTLPEDGLHPLMALAAQYSIDELKKECARKLIHTVQPEDLFSLHQFAYENNIPELNYALAQMTLDEIERRANEIKMYNE